MNTVEFLTTVLPSNKGLYCAVAIRNGAVRQVFVPTIKELANTLLEMDARGLNAHHACASFKPGPPGEKPTRLATNVEAVRSLWLDVDAGPGKPYADLKAAMQALLAFVRAAGLPAPLALRSGRGVHAYWPLDRDLTPGEWLPLAQALKLACRALGLQADPSRTADAASILRPVGTHNRKSEPILVKVILPGDRPTVEEIAAALAPYMVEVNSALGEARAPIKAGLNDDLKGGMDRHWFDWLTGPQKDACLAEMLDAIREVSDAGRDEWLRIVAACARSGAPSAHALCRDWSKLSPKYDARDFERAFQSFGG